MVSQGCSGPSKSGKNPIFQKKPEKRVFLCFSKFFIFSKFRKRQIFVALLTRALAVTPGFSKSEQTPEIRNLTP